MLFSSFRIHPSFSTAAVRWASKDEMPNDNPVKFSGSKADYDSDSSFRPVPSGAPSYQPICVLLSLAAFLTYFLILREENDIDAYLSNNVNIYMDPYGEAVQLQKQLKRELQQGKDTTRTVERLTRVKAIISTRQGDTASLDASLKRIEKAKLEKTSVFEAK